MADEELNKQYQPYSEAAQNGEFHELSEKHVNNLETAYKKIEEFIAEEKEFMGQVHEAIAKPVAFHHHDFVSVIGNAEKHLAQVEKFTKILEKDTGKTPNAEEAVKAYEEIEKNLAEIDGDIRKSMMTMVLITRVYAGYYRVRVALDKYLDYLGAGLRDQDIDQKDKDKILELIKTHKENLAKVDHIIKTLVFLSRVYAPTGVLYTLADEMTEVCKAEGVEIESKRISRHGMGTEFKGAGEGAE
ncbi:MAG: hypothetical protein ABIG20_02030 [archaeon]